MIRTGNVYLQCATKQKYFKQNYVGAMTLVYFTRMVVDSSIDRSMYS